MPSRSGYSTGDKFVRVIDLFDRLASTRRGLTTQEIADALEVNVRSAQRYIRQLRDDVGLDIVTEDGRYRLGEGSKLPALQLDRDQATALLIAVRLLQQLYPDRDPALVGAMARLATALRVPTVTQLLGRFVETVEERPENPIALQLRRAVVEGFTGQLKLEIEYTDARGQSSRRVIHPYFLEPRSESRTLYVFAHDEASGEVRLFRLDRICPRPRAARALRAARRLRCRRPGLRVLGRLAGGTATTRWCSASPPRRRPGCASPSGTRAPGSPTATTGASSFGSPWPARWRCARGYSAGGRRWRYSRLRPCGRTWLRR